jgi:hypothetical protein
MMTQLQKQQFEKEYYQILDELELSGQPETSIFWTLTETEYEYCYIPIKVLAKLSYEKWLLLKGLCVQFS